MQQHLDDNQSVHAGGLSLGSPSSLRTVSYQPSVFLAALSIHNIALLAAYIMQHGGPLQQFAHCSACGAVLCCVWCCRC